MYTNINVENKMGEGLVSQQRVGLRLNCAWYESEKTELQHNNKRQNILWLKVTQVEATDKLYVF